MGARALKLLEAKLGDITYVVAPDRLAKLKKEFFAEMSEAYFGMNDFFPFNRAELKVSEPETYDLMRTIGGPIAQDR